MIFRKQTRIGRAFGGGRELEFDVEIGLGAQRGRGESVKDKKTTRLTEAISWI
jgi:hypothetical protein